MVQGTKFLLTIYRGEWQGWAHGGRAGCSASAEHTWPPRPLVGFLMMVVVMLVMMAAAQIYIFTLYPGPKFTQTHIFTT